MSSFWSWIVVHKLWVWIGGTIIVLGIVGIAARQANQPSGPITLSTPPPSAGMVFASPSPSPVTSPTQTKTVPVASKEAMTPTGSCSPRGTATCDGEGRPITPGGGSGNITQGGGVGLASGVTKLTDVGLRSIQLSSGGTNGLAVDPETGLVYAVNNSTVGDWCGKKIEKRSDSLHVIDPSQAKEVASVTTDKGPVWPLVDTKNDIVYVATSSEGIVAKHRLGTGEKLGTIKVGGLPHDLGLDSESNILLVSNTNDGSQKYVAAVNAQTQQVIAQHSVAAMPHRIMLDPAKRLAYIVSVGSGTVSVFNTVDGTPAGQIETGGRGTLAFSTTKRQLYIPAPSAEGQAESIKVIHADTKQAVGTIGPFLTNAGHQAFGLAVDERNRLLFASLGDSNYVGIADLDNLKPLAVFEANNCTWGIAIDEKRQLGYVTNTAAGMVTVFDLQKIASQLKR